MHYHNPQCVENKSIELIHAELSTVYNLVKIIYSKHQSKSIQINLSI